MSSLLGRLGPRQRKGSKPRCHWITHGPANEVAARLTKLAAPWATVTTDDRWMPDGFVQTDEAELHKAGRLIPDDDVRSRLGDWWFAVRRGQQKAPSFDIASTCTVAGRYGLLLVEAKAHDRELRKEEVGKPLRPPITPNGCRNHARIGACMAEASLALAGETGVPWGLSRDWNYQMSNRFAWSWKLAELGFPVVLVYLGLLHAAAGSSAPLMRGARYTQSTASVLFR